MKSTTIYNKLYYKLYVILVTKLSNPVIYVLTYVILTIIIRIIFIKNCICEPEITVEYVKLQEPVIPQNLYTQMDPMYTTVEEQLNTRIDSNRKLVWNSDGTASLIYVKENITVKINSHYEAYNYLQKQKNMHNNTQFYAKPIPIQEKVEIPTQFSKIQVEKYFHQYENMLVNCIDKTEVLTTSIRYWSELIPKEMWAKTPDQIKDPNQAINRFLDELKNNIKINTQQEYFTYVYIQATLSTINALQLNRVTLESHPAIIEQIFYMAVGKMLTL